MLKKTITFQDLDGNPLTEDFYFNISKAELAELEIGQAQGGGLKAVLDRITQEKDGKKVVALLNEIVKLAYGVRSADNRRFIKNDEVWEDFYATDAHSELMFELYSNPSAGAAFITGCMPKEVKDGLGDIDGLTAEQIRAKAVEAMKGHQKKQD